MGYVLCVKCGLCIRCAYTNVHKLLWWAQLAKCHKMGVSMGYVLDGVGVHGVVPV